MKRRDFLRLGGGAVGLGIVGGGAVVYRAKPRKLRLPPRFADDARRPEFSSTARKVVIVGGGLAGLTAGIELARRRFDVTLVERAPHLGGKIAGWNIDALGERFPVEQGFRGFLAQYYNLDALLQEAGCDRDFLTAPSTPTLFADGAVTRPTAPAPFPLNLGQQLGVRNLGELLQGSGLGELLRYDPARTFSSFDGMNFSEFLRAHSVDVALVDSVLSPLVRTSMNRPARLSTAEAIRLLHFLRLGSPEGLAVRYLARSSLDAVVSPLRRLFESLGGTVRAGTTAQRLVREGNAVTQVVVDADPLPVALAHVPPGEVPNSGYHRVELGDGTPLFVARREGRYVAFDGRCTHMGCPVAPDLESADGSFKCPCHGGRFDAEGQVLRGPPERPLRRVPVTELSDGSLSVGGNDGTSPGTALPCDHCVVACEVRGARRLVAASSLGEPVLAARFEALGEADPYVVLRLWLDKPVRADRPPFYSAARFRYIDGVTLYSHFQEPFVGWARRTGGSAIELHAYAISPEDMAAPAELRGRILAELMTAMPELQGAKVLHQEFLQQDNFTRWAPGDSSMRPGTTTPLANLFLAGDWVKLDVPASLMEGAVVSGKLAANAVLDREALREVPVDSVPNKGALA